MKKEEFYFDSRDGQSRLHAVRWLPEAEPLGIVQIVHGMSEHVGRYEEFAQFLTGRGLVVTAEDHLGHGLSVKPGEPYGYFCEQDPATVVVRDVHRLKKMTQEKFPGLFYIIIGHSMGSFILRNYLYKYGSGIDGAILLGTGMTSPAVLLFGKALTGAQKLIFGEKHVGHMMNGIAFGAFQRRIKNPRTKSDWISRDEAVVDAFCQDPMCNFCFTLNGFGTLFELISRMQKKENLGKIPKELPILLASGSEDPVGDYEKGVKSSLEAFQGAGLLDVSVKFYPRDRHEILHEPDRQQTMEDLYAWICAKGGVSACLTKSDGQ